MKKATKSTTKKVKHEKAEEAPVETAVPGAAESPAPPPIAEFAFEAQAAPAEVAEQAAATPETPTYEEERTTGTADDGRGEASPVAAMTDAITESGPEEAITESAQPAATEAPAEPVPGKEKLSKLDLPALQSRYAEVLGRGTRSTSRAYIVWKIREAQKGKVRIGPRLARAHDAEPTKVLPVRVPAAAVAPLDEVRRRLGLRSRNEMIHKAVAAFLINAGESDLAGHFGATFGPDDADADAE